MDVFKIKTFLRAVELGSLSKAAQELDYAPSALSHMLRSLEQELGLPLLKRSPAGITLTEAGEQLLPLFRKAVALENTIYTAAEKLTRQVIHIGTYASISKYVLPKIVKEFNKAHPQMRISVTVGNRFTPEMVEKLDLVFAEKDIAEGQCWMPLLEDAYVAVVGEDSLPGQKRITLDELKETPFILPNDSAVNALCRDKLFNVLEVSSDDDTSPIFMVREGLGVTVLPKLSVQGEPGVRILSLEPTVKRTLGLTWSKANLTPGAAQLMGCIKRYFTEKEYE